MVSSERPTITGRWRITSMEMWDQDSVDAEVPGYIDFRKDRIGEFHFGYVQCDIDWREGERDGMPSAEFSFEGNDEMERTSGRGWAVLNDGKLNGQIMSFHGDKSGFTAKGA